MVDCIIIFNVTPARLVLQSLFFFVIPKATASCAETLSLSYYYRECCHTSPRPITFCARKLQFLKVVQTYSLKKEQKQEM